VLFPCGIAEKTLDLT